MTMMNKKELDNDFMEYLEYTDSKHEYEFNMDSDVQRRYKEHITQTIMFMVFHMMKETERMRNEINRIVNDFMKNKES